MSDSEFLDHYNQKIAQTIATSNSEFVHNKSGQVHDGDVLSIRKDKLISFFRERLNWIAYLLLAFIVFLAVRIRTSNLGGLRDVSTGGWTLGPDLDPFLFLRWAEYIVEHGKLFALDMMRYVPLGFETNKELLLHSHMIAWFHKLAVLFGSTSVTQSAAIYPAFMFGLTVVAFFFMTRKLFVEKLGLRKSNIIALVASFFLSVTPALLPRTIAGIPEKESGALVFLFLAFYFFISAWKSDKKKLGYVYALLAGISTAMMGLIWGGHIYIYTTLGLCTFVAFFLKKINVHTFSLYAIWLVSAFSFFLTFSKKVSIAELFTSTTTGFSVFVFFLAGVYLIIDKTKIKQFVTHNKYLSRFSQETSSLIIAIVVGFLLISLIFGPSFMFAKLDSLKNQLVSPVAKDRLAQTVAENRQPYFTEWAQNFGPAISIRAFLFFGPTLFSNVPLTFWLFFVGSVHLFGFSLKTFQKRDRHILSLAYITFLIGLIFSRYSASNSYLNGTSNFSLFLYAFGLIVMSVAFGFYNHKYSKLRENERLSSIDFGLLFALSFFLISIISARSAVRLIMMLVPSASIMLGYLLVTTSSAAIKVKRERSQTKQIFTWAVALLVILGLLSAGFGYYSALSNTAPGYVPSVYNQQWQNAMSWVRENTPESAVFGHWWDYGYWVQSIGKRATVLDGGNAVNYWNHLMGRHALTGKSDVAALEYLFSHDVTHFLIDSTDIGKYGAFSSIGSDESYDRRSFIPTFSKNNQATQETKNSTVVLYQGGVVLDEDIVYQSGENESRIFLPAGVAGIGGILIERDLQGNLIGQPQGLYVYQGQQYILPLRYAYIGEFIDYGAGVEAGFFIFPRLLDGGQLETDGSLLYLSPRTVLSQLARLYLYEEDNPHFIQAHSEDDFVVAQIKDQNPSFNSDFINYRGLRGPIRIWEVKYPSDMEIVPEYVQKEFPGTNILSIV